MFDSLFSLKEKVYILDKINEIVQKQQQLLVKSPGLQLELLSVPHHPWFLKKSERSGWMKSWTISDIRRTENCPSSRLGTYFTELL